MSGGSSAGHTDMAVAKTQVMATKSALVGDHSHKKSYMLEARRSFVLSIFAFAIVFGVLFLVFGMIQNSIWLFALTPLPLALASIWYFWTKRLIQKNRTAQLSEFSKSKEETKNA